MKTIDIAAHVLVGLVASPNAPEWTCSQFASLAYDYAEALNAEAVLRYQRTLAKLDSPDDTTHSEKF